MTKLLVVDTETGGVDPTRFSILSVGFAVWCDNQIVDATEVAVWEDPAPVTNARAMSINRIDLAEHRRRASPPDLAVQECIAFVRRHFLQAGTGSPIELVGYNVSFDVSFLRRLFRLGQADYDAMFSHRTVDLAAVIRFCYLAKILPSEVIGSQAAFDYFGITVEPGHRHTAMEDARATAELLTRLLGFVTTKLKPMTE